MSARAGSWEDRVALQMRLAGERYRVYTPAGRLVGRSWMERRARALAAGGRGRIIWQLSRGGLKKV